MIQPAQLRSPVAWRGVPGAYEAGVLGHRDGNLADLERGERYALLGEFIVIRLRVSGLVAAHEERSRGYSYTGMAGDTLPRPAHDRQ